MKKLLLSFVLTMLAIGSTWAKETTYTFNSKSWGATCDDVEANWTSGADGSQYNTGNQGVQITTGVSGANATSPVEFTNVTDIKVTYCTNNKAGKGAIELNVGDTEFGTITVTAPSAGGGTTLTSQTVSHAAVSGEVKLTVTCTTNSIYINSITITEADGNKQVVNMSWSDEECEAILGANDNTFPTLTVTPAVSPITYTSSKESVATIAADGTVTIVADGTTTIKASYAGNDEYLAANAEYTLVVVDPNRTYETFVFNTVAGLADLSIADPSSGSITISDDDAIVKGIVTITNTKGGNNQTAIVKDGKTDVISLRLYQDNTLTITVPMEFAIKSVETEATDKNGATVTVDWTINGSTATYTASAQVRFLTITVNYVPMTNFIVVENEADLKQTPNAIAYVDGAWKAYAATFGEDGLDEYINYGIEITAVTAAYERDCEPDTWQSVCLPFTADPNEIGRDWEFFGYTILTIAEEQTIQNGYLTFSVVDATEPLEAQKPYLIKSAEGIIEIFAGAGEEEATVTLGKAAPEATTVSDGISMIGTLANTELTTTEDVTYYALAGGEFRHGAVGVAKPLKAFRAYVTVENAAAPQGLKIRVQDTEDNTEGIEAVEIEQMQENVFYNLKGQKVNNPTSGIYIFNGQKVAIK